jgi:predicted dehydrogenase
MTPLRVGIIGYGYTGKLHARAFCAQPQAHLIAVCDSEKEHLQGLPEGIQTYESYEDLLASNLDAVSICVPTYLHSKIAIQALASGKHVLIEKPIAANLEQGHDMLNAAQAANRILYVGMTHRFYPELREAKQLIDAGAIGSIVLCKDCIVEYLGFLNVPHWYLERTHAGGGVALTSGIHLIDRLCWFTGDDVEMVAGAAGNPYFGEDVEDAAQIFLRFRGGCSAQITMAFLREQHPLLCDLEVIGTQGSIVVHTWQGYEIRNGSGRHERIFYTSEPHAAKVQVGVDGEVKEFCQSIIENRAPWPSAQESTRALEVVMSYYSAVATGSALRLRGRDAV